ncbi:nicotinamide-nucleotide amidohydrolase family protein [Paraglaciecola arctica]|uniref:nicotinamide-nucleotide amidohydrolase family protein n=1 Tax=Paraglaciecola arctica TaxID=1128911 RepID=UPI001C069ADC|nr:nicotinamide-nucleotide amidohydrolase family protein [Paraglaciecola arctica]MBU3004185.1 nicotinamide-nucleotide amidohydrolase family protein [Paraglaciecola arctica]
MTADITQLAQLLGNTLAAKGWHISCAESCTGGGVGYAITTISGSSAWFKKGFITYSNDAKQEMLNVSEQTLQQFGAVSAQTVEQMAAGAAQQAKAEVAVAISGIAGPDGGTPEKPVGTVWFGFFVNGQSSTEKLLIEGDRQLVRIKAIEFVLSHTLKLLAK